MYGAGALLEKERTAAQKGKAAGLTVTLSSGAVAELKRLAENRGTSVLQFIRRSLGLGRLEAELAQGNRLAIVSEDGEVVNVVGDS